MAIFLYNEDFMNQVMELSEATNWIMDAPKETVDDSLEKELLRLLKNRMRDVKEAMPHAPRKKCVIKVGRGKILEVTTSLKENGIPFTIDDYLLRLDENSVYEIYCELSEKQRDALEADPNVHTIYKDHIHDN